MRLFYHASHRLLCTIGFIFVLCLFCSQAVADDSAPIHIEADRMISQETDNSVIFIGNVDASQAELTIRCQEMTVYYTGDKEKKSKQGSSQVNKLICKEDVEIVQDDWLGTGERMDYFRKERKVILTGNAKAWQGQNMVEGKRIIYFLDEKRSIVEQDEGDRVKGTSGGRVKAVIHPNSDAKKKK